MRAVWTTGRALLKVDGGDWRAERSAPAKKHQDRGDKYSHRHNRGKRCEDVCGLKTHRVSVDGHECRVGGVQADETEVLLGEHKKGTEQKSRYTADDDDEPSLGYEYAGNKRVGGAHGL